MRQNLTSTERNTKMTVFSPFDTARLFALAGYKFTVTEI